MNVILQLYWPISRVRKNKSTIHKNLALLLVYPHHYLVSPAYIIWLLLSLYIGVVFDIRWESSILTTQTNSRSSYKKENHFGCLALCITLYLCGNSRTQTSTSLNSIQELIHSSLRQDKLALMPKKKGKITFDVWRCVLPQIPAVGDCG